MTLETPGDDQHLVCSHVAYARYENEASIPSHVMYDGFVDSHRVFLLFLDSVLMQLHKLMQLLGEVRFVQQVRLVMVSMYCKVFVHKEIRYNFSFPNGTFLDLLDSQTSGKTPSPSPRYSDLVEPKQLSKVRDRSVKSEG